jgi:hypothetical protein
LESIEEYFLVIDAPEVGSEEFDLGFKRLGMGIGTSVGEECKNAIQVIINGVASNFKMLNSGLMWDQWIFLGS